MKKILIMLGLVLMLGTGECFASTSNNQVFSADNSDGKISAKSIEVSFNASGMQVV